MNPYSIVDTFEKTIAHYAGSEYAVAVESCTSAIFLSLQYKKVQGKKILLPKFTYPGVACSIIHSGARIIFTEHKWEGTYSLAPIDIIDGALRFKRDMYMGGMHCLSFHIKKLLPIGRGGMILTNDGEAYEWLKRARFDGRNPVPLQEDNFTMLGWNVYMQPQDAARGLQLFQTIEHKNLPDLKVEDQKYADLSKFPIYTQ